MNKLEWLEICVKSKQSKIQTEWQDGYQNAIIDFLFLLDLASQMEQEKEEKEHSLQQKT